MRNLDKKVLILIKHGLYQPYIRLAQEGQGNTFLRNRHENIEVIHYYGLPGGRIIQLIDSLHERLRWKNRASNLFIGIVDTILFSPIMLWIPKVSNQNILKLPNKEYQVRVVDSLVTLRWKQLGIYKYVTTNYEFDFIYETNASSYVDYENLIRQVQHFHESPLYAGNSPDGKFISGANRFFDRQSIELILARKLSWSVRHLEDVAIGHLMKKNKVKKVVTSTCVVPTMDELSQIQDDELVSHYHFRTKSIEFGNRKDPELMREIESRLQRIRKK